MYSRVSKSVSRLLALACVASIPLALGAQAKPAVKSAAGDSSSKWDLFGVTASSIRTRTLMAPPQPAPGSRDFATEKVGTVESLTHYLNAHWGFQIDSGQHDRYINPKWSTTGSNSGDFHCSGRRSLSLAGTGQITPWVHALGGGGQLEGPDHQGYTPGYTFTAGGGVDYKPGSTTGRCAAKADYEFMHVDFGAPHHSTVNGWQPGGIANLEGIRAVAGVVYSIGALAPPPPVTLACSASPSPVFPGDPVTVTATAGACLRSQDKLSVLYSLNGAGLNATTSTATVATAALAPGAYTVNCGVKYGKAGKEGLKPWESATATAPFTVKQFEPPTISCSVAPTTLKPGDSAR